MEQPSHADVIVIGGGVVGLSTAYFASREGADVILLEKGEIGSGASHGNAGLIVPSHFEPLPASGAVADGLRQVSNPEGFFGIRPRMDPAFLAWLLRFTRSCTQRHTEKVAGILTRINRDAAAAHLDLADQGGEEYHFNQKGLLYLFSTKKGRSAAEKRASMADRLGIPAKRLSGRDVRAMEPGAGHHVIGGLYFPDDAGLHPALFLNWLAGRARSQGVRLLTQTEVYDLSGSVGRIKKIVTTKGDFTADQVVFCTGAWLKPLGRLLGLKLPVEGGKGISITFQAPGGTIEHPMLLEEQHIAISPLPNSVRITGLLALCGLDLSIDPRRVRGILHAARRALPTLRQDTPLEVWRGLRPCTPDGLPLIGRTRQWKNAVIAGGHDTKGLSMGPATGLYVSRILAGKSLDGLEKHLTPDRF